MIHRDFVEQVLSNNAKQEAMLRQLTNVPWPKPKVSQKDSVLHPVFMHSFDKCDKYMDQLTAELAEQRMLRDHRHPRRHRLATPNYDSRGFPYHRTRGASRLGETNPKFEMCFLELVKNQKLPSPRPDVDTTERSGEAEMGRDPEWLRPRPFTAPPRRGLVNMPITQQRGRSAPVHTEPKKEMPMPPKWKDSYGRPTLAAFLRWQFIATSRPNMTLQGKDRLCVELKKRALNLQEQPKVAKWAA